MTEMIPWNPLRIIPSFVGAPNGSEAEMEALYQSFDTMRLPIMCRRDDTGRNVGYLSANGMLARLTPDTGLMVNALHVDHPSAYEYGYIYRNPSSAIAWLLCHLGFAPNAVAYEREALIFHIPENDRPLRLAFEDYLNEDQYRMYVQLSSVGTAVERVRHSYAGQMLGSVVN